MSTEEEILKSSRVVAVVGLSVKPNRPSYRVASYLKENGYKIIPVNPGAQEILGEICYPNLSSIRMPVDVVDINYDLPEYREASYRYGATHFIAKGTSTRHEVVSTVEAVLAELGWCCKGEISKKGAESNPVYH